MPTAVRRVRESLARALGEEDTLDAQVAAANAILREAFAADVVAWGTIDPATVLSTSCAVFGEFDRSLPAAPDIWARERRLFEFEWEDRDPNTFLDMLRRGKAAAGLRADVDDVRSLRRYRELLEPLGVTDELRVVCSEGALAWSTVIFYRCNGGAPFSATDARLAESISRLLAGAFRRAMLTAALDAPSIPEPPGALLVAADGEVITSSVAAESLLSTADEHRVRTTLVSLALRTDVTSPTSAMIATAQGVLALHASPAKGLDGAASIVVERPRPVDLAPLVMAAFGFTERERAVVQRALAGAGRGAIARSLRISEDTVGDHLTSAYRKAGVGGRAELAARLFGEFYEQSRRQHVTPSPYGYFLNA